MNICAVPGYSFRQEFGLEGLVAKRRNSVYEIDRRSGAWVKCKIAKDHSGNDEALPMGY